jgi:hypothetical protein
MRIILFCSLLQFVLMVQLLWESEVFLYLKVVMICLSVVSLVASGVAHEVARRIYSDGHWLLQSLRSMSSFSEVIKMLDKMNDPDELDESIGHSHTD